MVSKTACTLALMRLVTDCMEMFFICCVGLLSCIIIIRFGDSVTKYFNLSFLLVLVM